MSEGYIYRDGRHVFGSHRIDADVTALLKREASGKFVRKTNTLTFTSPEGESFQVRVGEKYTIKYKEHPLVGEHGLVSAVSGVADYVYDEEAHGNLLVLQDAKISYVQYHGPMRKPTVLHIGYIPGMEIMHDKQLVFAWRVPHLQPVELTPAVQMPALSS